MHRAERAGRQLCVMLRKELYGGDPARAALSAFGQCRLLADGALPTVQEQCDAGPPPSPPVLTGHASSLLPY
jgi:hypothetical protein